MNRSSLVVGATLRRWIFSILTAGCLLGASAQGVHAQQQPVQVPTVEQLLNGAFADPRAADFPEIQSAIRRFFMDRDLPGSRDMLSTAQKKNFNLPPSEIMMAQFLAAAQQGPMARAELETGVKNSLEKSKGEYVDPEYYLIFGDIAFQERRFTDADLLFAKGEEMVKKFTSNNAKRRATLQRRAFAGQAAVAEAREDWSGAKEKLLAWLQVDEESAAAHQRMGRTLFKLNKTAEATAEFQKAAKADKTMLPAEVMMGRLYEEAQDHPNAEKSMNQAVATLNKSDKKSYIDTCLAIAQWAVSSASKDANGMARAKDLANKALAMDDSSIDARLVCGLIDRLNNDWTKAEGHFQKVVDLSPSNVVAINNLALVLAESGAKSKPKDEAKLKRALDFAQINARQYSQNPEAIATLGWVLYRMDKKEEAKQAIFAVAKAGAVTADAAFYVAQVLSDMGENSQAKMILDQALESKQPFAMRGAAEALKKEVDRKESGKGPEKPTSSDKSSGSDKKDK